MIDIWKYGKTLPKLAIETMDHKIFRGQVIGVFDAEEFEAEEDSLALELQNGQVISFFPSDIKNAWEI